MSAYPIGLTGAQRSRLELTEETRPVEDEHETYPMSVEKPEDHE